jgi:mono/diheme cytochrome c family protein
MGAGVMAWLGRWWAVLAGWGVILAIAPVGHHHVAAEDELRFGRDILPILSANCFACHGPDESVRQGKLRLDQEAGAKSAHDGGPTIVPGQPDASTLIARITSDDPNLVMPPPDSHKSLKPAQIDTLKRWIAQGAKWGKHWSFEPIERPVLDVTAKTSPIDHFVAQELARHGLALRPQANPYQLVRRLHLDLIGIPPTPEVAEAFAADPTDAAYARLVEELLARPEFGEHWARMWLDLARYADTKGYEKDLGRTMWPYRDWLVRALNADLPLDRMTIEQLAGDLLPNPTQEQLIATAFHRQTMSNDEGGTDDEEFRTIAVKDRVDTTLQVWMGLTAGCAKCHTHKYDPLSQHEYYGLYAIFNQTQDADRYDDFPTMELVSPEQTAERDRRQQRVTSLRTQLAAANDADAVRNDGRWRLPELGSLQTAHGATLTHQPDGSILAGGPAPAEEVYTVTLTLAAGTHTMLRLQAFANAEGQPAGVGRNPNDPNFVLSELEVERLAGEVATRIALGTPKADFEQGGWPITAALDGDTKTGWAVSPRQRENHTAWFPFAEPLTLAEATSFCVTLRQHYGDSLTLRRFRLTTTAEGAETALVAETSDTTKRLTDELNAAEKDLQTYVAAIPKLPVMRAVDAKQRRETKLHRRGNFLDPGDVVTPTLPAAFPASHSASTPAELDRLALANWLMDPANTLTPRVWANRLWARLFGVGLVETEEDFGALGSLPSHPELLDWLAAEYRDGGWSLKRQLRTMVLSRTYRQASEVTPELAAADPRNLLLSRGARYRLSAETIRDQTLTAAGLLTQQLGGPPVMPPQPAGLWRSTYNGQKWVDADGADRFRRALYTYLKRTTPYPSMTMFDSGSGEVCQIRRIRTNTPLQALVTLNDPVYLEAAGGLARRMLEDLADPVTRGIRLTLTRPARPEEIEPLRRLQQDVAAELRSDPARAGQLIAVTRTTPPAGVEAADYAGWIVVANTLLNLDEFLTRH